MEKTGIVNQFNYSDSVSKGDEIEIFIAMCQQEHHDANNIFTILVQCGRHTSDIGKGLATLVAGINSTAPYSGSCA